MNMFIDKNLNVPMIMASDGANSLHLFELLEHNHAEIIDYLNRYGTLLFRGFGCDDVDSFSQAIDLCKLGTRCGTEDYAIPRTLFPNKIYTSSDLPRHMPIPLHHEKPRSKKPPNHVYFCCVIPAMGEGGTILANAVAIWRDMPDAIQNKILKHGVVYKQFFHGNSLRYYLLHKILGTNSVRNWHEHFGTQQKQKVEQILSKEQVSLSWVNRDLIILNQLPGALSHPITKHMCWFNSSAYLNYYSREPKPYQSIANHYLTAKDILPLVCHYGNGQPFSYDDILIINRVINQHSVVVNWQKGDFMIVDNFTFMHGKQKHSGERLLYSCMTEL